MEMKNFLKLWKGIKENETKPCDECGAISYVPPSKEALDAFWGDETYPQCNE